MNCIEVKYYLNDYAKGILLDEIRSEIHDHINECNSCAKDFDELITVRSKAGLKRKHFIRKKEFDGENTSDSPNSIAAISSDAAYLKDTLTITANEIDNNKLFSIAGIISSIGFGIILAFLIFDNSPSSFWTVEKISGYPVIESRVLTNQGIIKLGEKLITDSESRARIRVGDLGEIDIEPQTEIKIVETETSEYRMVLEKGKMSVRTSSAPKLFSIETISAHVVDLGCMYYLSVDENGTTTVQVKSGWVLMKNKNERVLIPENSICSATTNGIGVPVSIYASHAFKESVGNFNLLTGSLEELKKILQQANQNDLITLFHLIKRLDQESREKIFNRISTLTNVPPRVNRDGIINGDKDILGRLWVDLGLGSISMYQNL